ncbi:MAG: hypothetical protein LBR70_04360 [Lactobacillaceae bacterium]|nr:hypothetical protein [Lactobacillaceae bacterium]
MANKIKLKICLPGEIYKEVEVDKVQIPAFEGDITILPERAPRVFILKTGFIRQIDSKNKGRYFIKSGLADYFEEICKIMTESVVDFNDMNVKEYEAKRDSAETDGEADYYQNIVDMINLEEIREV